MEQAQDFGLLSYGHLFELMHMSLLNALSSFKKFACFVFKVAIFVRSHHSKVDISTQVLSLTYSTEIGHKCHFKALKMTFNSPENLTTPLKLISSIITGSERPFAFTANRINRYELLGSRLSKTNDTGGLCVFAIK